MKDLLFWTFAFIMFFSCVLTAVFGIVSIVNLFFKVSASRTGIASLVSFGIMTVAFLMAWLIGKGE